MGHLFNGIASTLVVAACMRCAALRPDPELTHAFPPGFERTIHQSTFKHKHQRGLFRESFYMFARCMAANLLIRRTQQSNRLLQPGSLEFLNGSKGNDDPCFHIQGAGTMNPPIDFAVWEFLNGADWEDRIHVTENQN